MQKFSLLLNIEISSEETERERGKKPVATSSTKTTSTILFLCQTPENEHSMSISRNVSHTNVKRCDQFFFLDFRLTNTSVLKFSSSQWWWWSLMNRCVYGCHYSSPFFFLSRSTEEYISIDYVWSNCLPSRHGERNLMNSPWIYFSRMYTSCIVFSRIMTDVVLFFFFR